MARELATGSAACAILLVLSTIAVPSAAQAGHGVNVVYAEDMGCSDDEEDTWISGGADLRVTVTIDGIQVLQTAKAQNHEKPYFAAHADVAAPSGPVTVRIVVEEAEPAGFFSTRWVECDVAPGNATAYEIAWSGESRTITVTGDDPASAASVRVVLGDDGPQAPTVTVTPGHTDAVVTWTDAGSHLDRIRWPGFSVPEAPTGTDRHELDSLCDNTEYRMEVVRQSDSWLVAHPFTFTTRNLAPDPPEWTRITPDEGNWSMEWVIESAHDIERYEVHGGPDAGFTPDDSTLRQQVDPFFDNDPRVDVDGVPMDPDDTHVLVRAIDTGGLQSDSEARPLAEYQDSRPTPSGGCGYGVNPSGPATTQTQATADPSSAPSGMQTGTDEEPQDPVVGVDVEVPGEEAGTTDSDADATDAAGVSAGTLRVAVVALALVAVALLATLATVLTRRRPRLHRGGRPGGKEVSRVSWVCPTCQSRYRVPRPPSPGVVCPLCR